MSQINSILNHFAFLASCSIFAFFPCLSCMCVCVIARIQSKYCAHTHAYTISSGIGFELRMNVVCSLCPRRDAYSSRFGNDDDTHKSALSSPLWTTQVVFCVTPISIEIGSSSSTDCTTIVNYLIEYIDPGRLDQPSPFLSTCVFACKTGVDTYQYVSMVFLFLTLYTRCVCIAQLIYEYIS